MGSPCQLQLYADSGGQAASLAEALRAELERLEQAYSRYRPDSLLCRLNASAGSGHVQRVDAETAALLDYADTCFRQSGGRFDPTSGVLAEAWLFRDGQAPASPPTEEALTALQARVGWDKLQWQSPALLLPAGMQLDLGGIVKEYAADSLATLAREQGCAHGLIELGGDIRVIGPHPDGSPWQIGISDPRQPGRALAELALDSGALATSGTYARCFHHQGRLYHHILNPRTGWPISGLLSVSVVAGHCLIAGSAATIGLLQEQAAVAWLESLGLPWLGVDQQFRVVGSLLDRNSLTDTGESHGPGQPR